jgi:hypothetical protein
VEVDRIPAEHPFLAEMGEAGVADRAFAEGVIERVAANAVGIGAFDNHVPREVRHLAAELALAVVLVCKRLVSVNACAVDAGDFPLLGSRRLRVVAEGAPR